MKLVRAQVQNFKAVENSGEFGVEADVTCLVGKNEAGKTALLTAMYRVNPVFDNEGQFDKQKEYPRRFLSDYSTRHEGNDANVVTMWFELDDGEEQRLVDLLGEGALKSRTIKITKGYENVTYWSIDINGEKLVANVLASSSLYDEEKEQVAAAKTVGTLIKALGEIKEPSSRVTDLRAELTKDFPEGSAIKGAIKQLELPKVMLFSQYQRMSGQISVEDLVRLKAEKKLTRDDQVFLALCEMAGTTLEEISGINQFEDLIAKFEAASNKITREIFAYWSQNRFLKVQFRLDAGKAGDPHPFNSGQVVRTRILNLLHEATVPFDDRSTGFVWFFSFLVLFSQIKRRHPKQRLLILLDEPGLSLHGRAQADLLRFIDEKLAPDHQVIFTTHSPFMVPPNLLRARTVEDVVEFPKDAPPIVHGTKVGSDILSTDPDTVFPLQGALGYEITQSLFVGEHTLLVEGPSELLYFRAFSEELRSRGRTALDRRWVLCPSGGIDKIAAFMSLFHGNKLHVAVLTDYAFGQKKKVEELRRSTLLRAGHVLTCDMYSGQNEADIEDVVGADLYASIVNDCYDLAASKPVAPGAPGARIVKHVEDHFRTLPPHAPEFNHYPPSAHLLEHRSRLLAPSPTTDAALDRFERLFKDLNAML